MEGLPGTLAGASNRRIALSVNTSRLHYLSGQVGIKSLSCSDNTPGIGPDVVRVIHSFLWPAGGALSVSARRLVVRCALKPFAHPCSRRNADAQEIRVLASQPGIPSDHTTTQTSGLSCDNLRKNDAELLFSSRRRTMEYDAKYFETFRATLACNGCSACRGRIALFSA